MGIKLRGRILYTSVVAVLLHGCEHWRLTRQMEADLVKAHHGMHLGLLRLTRKAAAERHITRAEARLRTGVYDILGLLEERKIKRGTKLMQVHRSAPSLPSILLAGEPAMLRYPVPRGATGIKFWRRDGTRGAPLHWEAQWLELLDTCLEPPGRVGGLTDALVLEEGYSKLATRPMEIRAKALARCLQCGTMQNSEQERQLHIMRVHGGAPDQDDNSTQRQGAPEAAGGAGEGEGIHHHHHHHHHQKKKKKKNTHKHQTTQFTATTTTAAPTATPTPTPTTTTTAPATTAATGGAAAGAPTGYAARRRPANTTRGSSRGRRGSSRRRSRRGSSSNSSSSNSSGSNSSNRWRRTSRAGRRPRTLLLTQPPLDDDRSIVMCDICFGTEGSGTALLFVDNVFSGSCQYRESVVACLPDVRKGPSSLVSNMSERDVPPSSHTKPIQTALESGAPILWGAMREGEVQDRLAAWFYRIPEVE